jgi:predicted nucleic acid-binding protein
VKAFYDTSVLVAAFLEQHVHHAPSLVLFDTFEKRQACCSLHSLAEVYSSMTRLPSVHISGNEALRFVDNLQDNLTLIALEASDYRAGLERAAEAGVGGGTVYDALLIQAAVKARAENIYTWNVSHFRRLGADVAHRIKSPAHKT